MEVTLGALSDLRELFDCNICCGALSNPTSIQCGHIFCTSCVWKIQKSKNAPTCPLCKAKVSRRALRLRTDLIDLRKAVQILIQNCDSEILLQNLPSSNSNSTGSSLKDKQPTNFELNNIQPLQLTMPTKVDRSKKNLMNSKDCDNKKRCDDIPSTEWQCEPLDLSHKGVPRPPLLTAKQRPAFKFVEALDLSLTRSDLKNSRIERRTSEIKNPPRHHTLFSLTATNPKFEAVLPPMQLRTAVTNLETSLSFCTKSVDNGRLNTYSHLSQDKESEIVKETEVDALNESVFQASLKTPSSPSGKQQSKKRQLSIYELEIDGDQMEKRTKLSSSIIAIDSDVVFIEENNNSKKAEIPEGIAPLNSSPVASLPDDTCFPDDMQDEKDKEEEGIETLDSDQESECSFLAATPTTTTTPSVKPSRRFSRKLSFETNDDDEDEAISAAVQKKNDVNGKESPRRVILKGINGPELVNGVEDLNYDTCPVKRGYVSPQSKENAPDALDDTKSKEINLTTNQPNPMEVDEDYENANECEEDFEKDVDDRNSKNVLLEEKSEVAEGESKKLDEKSQMSEGQFGGSLHNGSYSLSQFPTSREEEFNELEDSASSSLFKMPSLKERRSFVFCPTRLTRTQLAQLNELCEMCHGKISKEYTDEVTHLVINLEKSRVPQTIKYLFAIADKKWVVIFDWVKDCLKDGQIVFEEPYETSSFPDCDSGVRKSRKTPSTLFQGTRFYFATNLKNSGASLDDCKKLVGKLGGQVVSNPYSEGDNVLIIGDASQMENTYQEWYRTKGWLTVSWEWILDCILSYYIIPFSNTHLITNLDGLGIGRACLPKALLDANQSSPLDLFRNFS